MQTGDQPTPIQLADQTGHIRVVVGPSGVPAMELGFALKSAFEPVQFSLTALTLINQVRGDFHAQELRNRSKALVESGPSPASSSYSVEERIERISARVSRAREAFISVREGQNLAESRSVGLRNRIFLEGRDGFVWELHVNPEFYGSFSNEVIEKELNQCLEQLFTGAEQFTVTPQRWDEEG